MNKPNDRDPGAAGELNALMREVYRARCQSAAVGFPVLIHLEDMSLVLRQRERRWSARNPHEAEYLLLKDVVHLPLSLFLCFDRALGAPPEKAIARLRALLPKVREQVDASGLSTSAKAKQQVILARAAEFLAAPGDLRGFLRDLGAEIHFNIAHAAELRIAGLHRQIEEWFHALGAEEWRELRVVIATSHMARQDNLAEQYFEWLLEDESRPRHQKRVIKVEGLENEADALGVFGVHLVDSKAGEAFFGEADYLHRDVLAPPVPAILEKLDRPC